MIHRPTPPTRIMSVRTGLKRSFLLALSTAAITTAAILLSASAHAQEAGDKKGDTGGDWNVTVGGGAIYTPDYEGSDDFDVLPFPFIAIGYKDIAYIRGPELGLNLIRLSPAENLKILLGPIARYRRDRPQKRNPDLAGLGNIDAAIEVGGNARIELGQAWFQGSLAKDVAGGHDGLVGVAGIGYDFDLSDRLTASVSGHASWVDDKYMRTYFSVTPQQSLRSGLPVYSSGKGLKDAGAGLGLRYRLDGHWMIATTGSYTRLMNDAEHAPLVRLRGSANQWQGGAFIAYRF